MENEIIEKPITLKKRPTFLTVICILTWVGCAISIFSSLNQMLGPGPREQINKMATQAEKIDGKGREMMDSSIEFMSANLDFMEKWTFPASLIGLLSTGLCLFGSIWMWKLRKQGFLFYSIGEVIPIILAIISFTMLKQIDSGMMAMIMKFSTGFSIVIGIAFMLMYRANLKHMTN
jgi:hypothetical protein